jgi:hypothetical protein
MAHRKTSKRSKAKTILRLAGLEQSKNAVLHALGAASSQESYGHAIDEFIGWYCSEPRLAFNRTVVLRYRFFLEQKNLAPCTINVRLAAVTSHRLSAIELEIIEGQRAAALLLVIMTFVHDTRPVPSVESAPGHGAGLTRRPDQFQNPHRMRLTDRISRNRGLSNGYRHPTAFGHYGKGDQEVQEQWAQSFLPTNRLFPSIAGYFDIIGVKFVEDLKIFFETSGDLGLNGGRI